VTSVEGDVLCLNRTAEEARRQSQQRRSKTAAARRSICNSSSARGVMLGPVIHDVLHHFHLEGKKPAAE